VRYARKIADAHHVSKTSMQSPCVSLVRIMPPTILPRRYAPAESVQSSYLTLSGCQLLPQGGPRCATSTASAAAASTATTTMHSPAHRRRRKPLRRQRCTARRIGGCGNHRDGNDAQPGRFSHGRRGRDVRYACAIVDAHHVS
jgi:hypothetical protein